MNWSVVKPWVGLVARLVLGVVWIWASLAKIAHPLQFVQTVRAYDMTWEWLSKAIGYGLPVLLLCLGVVLIAGIQVRIAAAVSGVLCLVFLIGLSQAAARGLSVACGCFTAGKITQSGASHALPILMVIGLLILSAYLVVFHMTRFSVEEYLARHDYVEMPSAKRMRSAEGRRRYEARVAEVRKTARSRNLYLTALIWSVVVLVSVIGIGVQSTRAKITGVIQATFANPSDGVVFGKKAAATVELYADFGCVQCREFSQSVDARLEKEVRANLAEVRYHPIAVLDWESPNRYSTRAASASICASDNGDDAFVTYHDALFGRLGSKPVQPAPGEPGLSNAKLVALGAAALNLSSTDQSKFRSCVTSGQYGPIVQQLTETASKRGIAGPFAVYVNGSRLPHPTASSLFAAIAEADKHGPPPQPSQTPTPPPASPSGTPSTAPADSSPSGTPTSSPTSSPSPSPSRKPTSSNSTA